MPSRVRDLEKCTPNVVIEEDGRSTDAYSLKASRRIGRALEENKTPKQKTLEQNCLAFENVSWWSAYFGSKNLSARPVGRSWCSRLTLCVAVVSGTSAPLRAAWRFGRAAWLLAEAHSFTRKAPGGRGEGLCLKCDIRL